MLIEGEKWACEACVRGHRVSNCQHADRPLQHINKKGRPVSQCQHCRAMRKSRSSHIKCDCGEKTSKCAHLRTPVEGHRESCCCNHGGRCTCSHKSSPPLDTVVESDSDRETTSTSRSSGSGNNKTGAARGRRRANTGHSEGGSALTFDESGRRKPAREHTKTASQKCGPYPLNYRSVENLLQGNRIGGEPRRRESHTTAAAAAAYSRSGTTSPLVSSPAGAASASAPTSSAFHHLNGQLPPLDMEYPPTYGYDAYGGSDDAPLYSAGLSTASGDWGHFDFPGYGNHGGSGMAYDFSGSEQPALTATSNSGEVSEVEDYYGSGGADPDRCSPPAAATTGRGAMYRISGGAAGYGGMLASPGAAAADLNYQDILMKSAAAVTVNPAGGGAYSMGDEAVWATYPDGIATIPDSPADGPVAYW